MCFRHLSHSLNLEVLSMREVNWGCFWESGALKCFFQLQHSDRGSQWQWPSSFTSGMCCPRYRFPNPILITTQSFSLLYTAILQVMSLLLLALLKAGVLQSHSLFLSWFLHIGMAVSSWSQVYPGTAWLSEPAALRSRIQRNNDTGHISQRVVCTVTRISQSKSKWLLQVIGVFLLSCLQMLTERG